jgi:hypothetical protein
LGFSAGSQQQNWKSIEDELVNGLEHFRERRSLVIGVIDAAIRGDGSLSLAKILQSVKQHFDAQPWRVVFHLLHSRERENHRTPILSDGIEGLTSTDLIFERVLHEVPSLLVEDWDEGLGLKVEWDKDVCIYKNSSFGQVIVKHPDESVAVLESPELPRLINELIAQSVTEAMLSDPNLLLKADN